jgi:hypothetical protein
MLDIHESLRVSNALLVAAGSAILLGGALTLLSRWRFAPGPSRCPACRFDLRGLQNPAAPCSECGDTTVTERTIPRARRILVRAAVSCSWLAIVPLIGLYAHPASRPRAISWFFPWEGTARTTVGDAVAITETLRFPEPIPEDGIMERLRVVSPRGSVTLGENAVWRVNPADLGDGVPRLVVDLYSGGSGGFGGTWLVTVAPDAPPSAVMVSERATIAPWAAILADHESDELDAFGRTLPRPEPPSGIGLAMHSFRTHGFVSRALTPGMDVTAEWNGSAWDIACPLCAYPISDQLYAELAAAVRTRMAAWAAEHADTESAPPPRSVSIVPLLRAVATLAQAGHRDRAEQLARELFVLDPTIPYNDCTTRDAFVKAWTDAFDAEGIQHAAQTPSSRSSLSAARIGDASNPSSDSGSATSSH